MCTSLIAKVMPRVYNTATMQHRNHPQDEHFVKQKHRKITKYKRKCVKLEFSHNLGARIALHLIRRLTGRNVLCVQAFETELLSVSAWLPYW